jgi:hypothetical protein
MTPLTFCKAVRKLAPLLNERLSAEALDAIRRIIEDPEKERVSRDDAITLACELFLRVGAVRRR